MTKIILNISFLFLTLNVLGQNSDFCHPIQINELSEKILSKIPKKEKDSISQLNSYNEYFSFDDFYIFNYEDYKSVIKFFNLNGVQKIPEYKIEHIISRYSFHKLKGNPICLSEITQPYLIELKERERYVEEQMVMDSINGIYIPFDLNDALNELDTALSTEEKEGIKKISINDFIGKSHLTIGRWMRNNWGLYGHTSRLNKYFENFGITDSEDMTGIILKSFYRRTNNLPIEFENQIQAIINSECPQKKDFPKYVKNVERSQTIFIEDENENYIYTLYFFSNLKKDVKWIFHPVFGWKIISPNEYNTITELEYQELNEWFITFYNRQ
ncbi:DUF6794 domain-containing protein [Bizionia arctica]|uniref:DUF6794 domain-containing protein n=1 Tax=Bizionia arctica TaxID=1495645 RepID=A0A917GIS7_9FLAO|nr:DUF6794 domain-containing protein [Bizionia arctica]GGG47429.1 hypothetical protein GCM10010976_18560 [Bizionia arctica]